MIMLLSGMISELSPSTQQESIIYNKTASHTETGAEAGEGYEYEYGYRCGDEDRYGDADEDVVKNKEASLIVVCEDDLPITAYVRFAQSEASGYSEPPMKTPYLHKDLNNYLKAGT